MAQGGELVSDKHMASMDSMDWNMQSSVLFGNSNDDRDNFSESIDQSVESFTDNTRSKDPSSSNSRNSVLSNSTPAFEIRDSHPREDIAPEKIVDSLDKLNFDVSSSLLFSSSSSSNIEPGAAPGSKEHTVSRSNDVNGSVFAISVDHTSETIVATLEDGSKLYLTHKPTKTSLSKPNSMERNHYGIPIYKLLSQVNTQRSIDASKQQVMEKKTIIAPCSSQQLLSEKWRPKKWTDLTGSEKTHRFMMRWLVTWSVLVFGGNSSSTKDSEYGNKDRLGRPNKKILLIHGPPGIGKTTIAHIMAKQAGYDVLEINASDERSGAIVKDSVNAAVGSHRVDSDRPVCIIADEIEGAAENGFIKVLVDLITNDQKALSHKGEGEIKSSKTKKKNFSLLQRPIIAICNDPYANSLRTLRPFVEMVHYTKIPKPMLITRLKHICEIEKLKVDTSKLTEVAEATDGDLRSSLNILQFGLEDGQTISKKDLNQSWSYVSNRVFRRNDELDKNTEMIQLQTEVDSNGEYDKLMSGCFNLYPKVQFMDDLLRRPTSIGEWTHFYEQLCTGVYQSQFGQLADYFSHPVLAFHSLFSSNTNIKNERIPSDYEIYESFRANSELGRAFTAQLDPSLRLLFNKTDTATELAPYVLKIISPSVESPTSLKKEDRRRLQNTINALQVLKLRFTKDKLENGAMVYKIDPPIEYLAIFDEGERQRQSVGKYGVRQVINDMIYKEKGVSVKRTFSDIKSEQADYFEDDKRPKVAKKEKARKLDFFGRVIEESSIDITKSRSASPGLAVEQKKTSTRVWIQYVEGFSNAVRKDISWADLWSAS